MQALLILNFIIPFVMLLVGGLLRKHPQPYRSSGTAKWKAGSSGYNTPCARKSKAHWDLAQRVGPDNFVKRGKQALFSAVCFTIVGLIVIWWVGLAAGMVMGYVGMILAFWDTERELKERFGE